MGILAFSLLLALSSCALAAYIGMVAFLTTLPSVPRFGAFVFTALVILIPTTCFLIEPYSSQWLDAFTFKNAGPDRAFFAGYFFINACFFIGMALSFFGARRLPASLRRTVRRICACAAIPSVLWVATEPRSLFLPPVFVPNAVFVSSRLLFLTFFLLISFGTYCLLAASAEKRRE